MFYKPLPHPLSPSTPQGGVDGSRIPFKQMGKPRARERNETFQGCLVSGRELLKSSLSPCEPSALSNETLFQEVAIVLWQKGSPTLESGRLHSDPGTTKPKKG